eukprot:13875942-Ditylum_brightwellii.AAC.1
MSEMFTDMEEVHAYIDNLLLITTGSWENHLEKLGQVLGRLNQTELKVNAQKSFFSCHGLEYLRHWMM